MNADKCETCHGTGVVDGLYGYNLCPSCSGYINPIAQESLQERLLMIYVELKDNDLFAEWMQSLLADNDTYSIKLWALLADIDESLVDHPDVLEFRKRYLLAMSLKNK